MNSQAPFKIYIPRAMYYMRLRQLFFSFFQLLFTSSWRTSSHHVGNFKEKLKILFQSKNIFLIPHARIGLYLTLKHLNFPRGSEILMTPLNIPEMIKMLALNGLTPSYVGYRESSFDLDYSNLKIGPKTKAFIYTPLAGITTDMDVLTEFCKNNNLVLIQDLTQSLGQKFKNRWLHEYSPYSFFSFCDLKTLHTHRGGMIITKDESFIAQLEENKVIEFSRPHFGYFFKFVVEDFIAGLFLRRHFFHFFGAPLAKWSQAKGNFIEQLTSGQGVACGGKRLFKDFMASGNDWQSETIPPEQTYQFSDFQAKIGLERLINWQTREIKRIKNAQLFYQLLDSDSEKMKVKNLNLKESIFWKTPLLVKDFKDFQKFMLDRRIDVARSNLTWLPDLFNPLSQNVRGKEMKENCVYIPLHYYLNPEEIKTIVERVNQYSRKSLSEKNMSS